MLTSIRAIDSVAMLRQVSSWLLMYSRAMADSSADSNVGKRDLICCQTGISGKIMAWIRGSTGAG